MTDSISGHHPGAHGQRYLFVRVPLECNGHSSAIATASGLNGFAPLSAIPFGTPFDTIISTFGASVSCSAARNVGHIVNTIRSTSSRRAS